MDIGYFEIFGFALFCIALLVALGVALAIYVGVRKRNVAYALFLLVALPTGCHYLIQSGEEGEARKFHKNEADRLNKTKVDALQAFASYCKTRKHAIYSHAHAIGNAGLAVSVDDNFKDLGFTGIDPGVENYTGKIVNLMRGNPEICLRSGIKFIQGKYDNRIGGKYSSCDRSEFNKIPNLTARYELVMGKTGRKNFFPSNGNTEFMANASVQVVDLDTGYVLAEDTIYNFSHLENGMEVCPSTDSQLIALIDDVFGK